MKMDIQKLLSDNQYLPIVNYLHNLGISTVEAAKDMDLDDLYFVPNISLDDVLSAIEKIQDFAEVPQKKEDRPEYSAEIGRGQECAIIQESGDQLAVAAALDQHGDSNSMRIEEAFADLKGYPFFTKYCIENGICYLPELCDADFHPANFINVDENLRVELLKRYEELNWQYSESDGPEETTSCGRPLPTNLKEILLTTDKLCFRKDTPPELKAVEAAAAAYNINQPESVELFKHSLILLYIAALNRVANQAFRLRISGKTLEECGEATGITRERVRQIVVKIVRRLSPLLSTLVKFFSDDRNICTVSDLESMIAEESGSKLPIQVCVFVFKQKNSVYPYLPFLDAVLAKQGYTECGISSWLISLLEKYADNTGTMIPLSQQWDAIQEDLKMHEMEFFSYEDVCEFLYFMKFQEVGDVFLRANCSNGQLISQLVHVYFPNGINTSDPAQMQLLRKYIMEVKPNINLANDHAITAQMDRETDLVLCGRSTYTHVESVECDLTLLEEIVEYVEASNRDQFVFNDLYALFQEKLESTSTISNPAFLHGMMRYYFSDDFDFTRDSLIKRGYVRKSLSRQIYEVLVSYKDGLSLEELKKHFPSLTALSIGAALQFEPDIVYWGACHYNTRNHVIAQAEQRNVLCQILMPLLSKNDGCTSSYLLYKKLLAEAPMLVKEFCLNSQERVFSFAQANLSSEFKFSSPNISTLDFCEGPCTSRSVLLHKVAYNGVLDMDECRKFGNKMHWAVQTTDAVLAAIHSEFVRINRTCYVDPDKVKIEPQALQKIQEILNDHLASIGYISIQDFHDFSDFPQIGFSWNPSLLYGVATHFCTDFLVIAPRNSSRNSLRFYIVLKSSQITKYAQLVKKVMQQENIFKIKESDMLGFLTQRGLALQVIPYELYNGDTIRYEQESFMI